MNRRWESEKVRKPDAASTLLLPLTHFPTHAPPAHEVSHGENRAEIVRRMSPFCREPGIVEIQPAHERADIERGGNWVENMVRARHTRAVRHDASRHDRAE